MYVFSKPPVEKKLDFDNIDVNKLVKEATPPLEGCRREPFESFGNYYFGIADGFNLRADYKDMNELEKWKYIALCNTYWMYFYEWLNEKKHYEEYKVQLKEWAKKNPDFLITLEELEKQERSNS